MNNTIKSSFSNFFNFKAIETWYCSREFKIDNYLRAETGNPIGRIPAAKRPILSKGIANEFCDQMRDGAKWGTSLRVEEKVKQYSGAFAFDRVLPEGSLWIFKQLHHTISKYVYSLKQMFNYSHTLRGKKWFVDA